MCSNNESSANTLGWGEGIVPSIERNTYNSLPATRAVVRSD